MTDATTDGDHTSARSALTSFTDARDTTAAVEVEPANLGSVDDPDQRANYAAEATRMAEVHEPDDVS